MPVGFADEAGTYFAVQITPLPKACIGVNISADIYDNDILSSEKGEWQKPE